LARDFLTDSEYAVTIDSLAIVRDQIIAEGRDTPTIDSALAKLYKQVAINSYGLWIEMRQCTSDDPTNHQGDTCPVHEDINA
jgi:hypothetical protein